MVFDKELDENLKVCPKCQFHFPIGARERIHSLVETCSFEEMDADMMSVDVLSFHGCFDLRIEIVGLPEDHGPEGRGDHGHRENRRTPIGVGRDGFQFSGAVRWVSVVGEEADAAHREGDREGAAGGDHFRERRVRAMYEGMFSA